MSDVKNDNEKSILDALNKNYDNFIIIISGILSIIIAPVNKWILISPIISCFSILISHFFYNIMLYLDDTDFKAKINYVIVGIIGFINLLNIIFVMIFLVYYICR
jgi:hypothetical protein